MAYDDSTSESNAPEGQDLFICSHNPFKGVTIPKSPKQTTWNCAADAMNILYSTCKTTAYSPKPINGLLPRELGYSVGGTTGLGILIMATHFHKHPANEAEEMVADDSSLTPNAGIQFRLRPLSEVPNHVIDPQILLVVQSGDDVPPSTSVQVEHAYLVESSDPMHVFAFSPHTHLIGTEVQLSVKKKDGHETRLATIDDPSNSAYDTRPVRIQDFEIEQGDEVIVTCKFDNNLTMVMDLR